MKLQDRITCIYRITSPSGNVYIGQTIDFKSRMAYYKRSSGRQPALFNSIKKHGLSSHDIHIIHLLPNDISSELLDEYEKLYISQYKACGFVMLNLKDGGSRGSHSPTTRYKISVALLGRPKSVEHNKKVGDANRGRKMPDSFKKSVSDRCKGSKNYHVMQAVTQYTKEGVFINNFLCPRYAMNETGISETAISNCLNNRSKTAGGYKWSYQNK